MRNGNPAVERACVVSLAVLLLAAERAASPPAGVVPERPRMRVERTYAPPSGRFHALRAGANLQDALRAAQPGDVIALEAGATFTGPFTLPDKPGAGWITIQSGAPDSNLPPPGTRVEPAHAGAMPKLESAAAPVLAAAPGAHHYRFVGIEIRPRPGAFLYNVVSLGASETSLDQVPHHIVFERCYIHGDPRVGSRRGIALNSRGSAVLDSYLSDFKEAGADAQAIAGWNGPGPFRIENNYLEASGENLLFGGADPAIRDLVPSDIEVLRNHLAKPLSWKAGEPGYAGTRWTVKNLLELKNARRVWIEGNILENNWPQGQNGFGVLFTVRNQDGQAPWSVVEDVTFVSNVVRHTTGAINILGHDDLARSEQTRRIAIRNNLLEDVGGQRWGGGGTFLQMLAGSAGVVVEHNTVLHAGNIIMAEGVPHSGFVFRDTIAFQNQYGIAGAGTAPGKTSLAAYFPQALFRRNVIVGGDEGLLPADTFVPSTIDDVGFTDWRQGDYRLKNGSKYAGAASDGKDVGVDVDALQAALGPPPPAWRKRKDSDRRSVELGEAVAATLAPSGVIVAVFWGAVLLLAYTHLGYPVLIRAWAGLWPVPVRRRPIEPDVSVLIVAQDESARIEGRLANLLSLDYPRRRLEIVLASDGSRDGTVEHARAYEGAGVRVLAFSSRRGKPSVLNELVPRCRGEIVVLADARQRFDPGALRALVAPFADPRVGAVSGELILTHGGGPVGEGIGFYWRWEKGIRAAESRVDSSVGATGAIYAIRRELFESIPPDTVLDDVLIPLQIAGRGYRVVFEPGARAYDRAAAWAGEEMARKTRTIAGNFQLFFRQTWLLNPFGNRLWWQTVSHKGLRLLTPLLLMAAALANVALLGGALYRDLLAAQAAFYAVALVGHAAGRAGRVVPLIGVPYVVCLLAWATVLGFLRFATGRQAVTWARASVRTAH